MTFLLGLIYLIVTGTVLVSMAALFLRGKRVMANRIFFVCQGMIVLWCSSQILIMLAKEHWQLTIAYLLGNVGICFVGAFWYYFSFAYSGRMLSGGKKYIPIVLSGIHYVLVLTNHWHHAYYAEFTTGRVKHGPFFYTNVLQTYVLVIWGALVLYGNTRKGEEKQSRRAKGLIVLSVLTPLLFNAIYMAGLVKSTFDITPLGFAISILLVLLATVKYQFMDLRRELAITSEKLLLEQERNRIAQQVHDTAGHTLTMLQSYMKLAQVAMDREELSEAREYLADARKLSGQGIRELRESINQLRREEKSELVTQGVMQLVDQVKEIPIELTIQGEDSEAYSHLSKVIYDTLRETITNTLKYSQCSQMEIVLRFKEKQVDVLICDDGVGCETISDNNGLRGIRERVEKAKGTVRFQSAPGEGFFTSLKLPV